ncbi:hypothetical protein ACFB49_42860 [Sphingomonas sp. DBB INV C78]|uniref:hypothetical protein n=1 Tax=Sphingomonas sp. DBB INV C78 TaxID=3349434 RepID=UPI0036D210EE
MSDDRFIYLDVGEIYQADSEGLPTDKLIAVVAGGLDGEADRVGALLAAAPKLLEACKAAQEGMRQLYRNHIASTPDEARYAEELLEAAIAEAEDC